jgi:predicted site-specific integrase-resolvase
MKLSHYAKKLGLHYRTAWNMFNKGQIPRVFKLPSGTIIVPEEFKNNLCGVSNKVIICGRVSSHKQKNDLEAQVQRLTNYAISKGYQIVKIFKEVASEFNDNRRDRNMK